LGLLTVSEFLIYLIYHLPRTFSSLIIVKDHIYHGLPQPTLFKKATRLGIALAYLCSRSCSFSYCNPPRRCSSSGLFASCDCRCPTVSSGCAFKKSNFLLFLFFLKSFTVLAVFKTPCRVFYVTEVGCALHTFGAFSGKNVQQQNDYKLGGSIISTREPCPLEIIKLHYAHFHCESLRCCYYSATNKASCRIMSYATISTAQSISNL
jgi:hypothetical protein